MIKGSDAALCLRRENFAEVRSNGPAIGPKAGITGVSPDTITRWCKNYGIGKQLHPKAPWRVDPDGLEIVTMGGSEALMMYHEMKTKRAFPLIGDKFSSHQRGCWFL